MERRKLIFVSDLGSLDERFELPIKVIKLNYVNQRPHFYKSRLQ